MAEQTVPSRPSYEDGRRLPRHDSTPSTAGSGHPPPYGPGPNSGGAGLGASRWVGPDGLVPVDHRTPPLPDLSDDRDRHDSATPTAPSRRRALLAMGGAAAVIAGGSATFAAVRKHSASPETASATFNDGGAGAGSDTLATQASAGTQASVATQASAGTQAGQAATQAGTAAVTGGGMDTKPVHGYADQNESYMGSKAGAAVKANTPTSGKTFASPAAAAAGTKVTVKTVLAKDPIRHLANRTTFGATPALLAHIRAKGINAWLAEQLQPTKIAPTPAERKLSELRTLAMTPQQVKAQRTALDKIGIKSDLEVIEAAVARQIWSDRQLFEVMVDFWNDFLHVGPYYDDAEYSRPGFDRDVIRKYALDNYPDMFVAAQRHPALLRYLNQDQSSKYAINENLARENLELFTVGVNGGYTENDVRQAARLQTGRGIQDIEYIYRPEQHYVGRVKIMGFSHPNSTAAGGEKAADEYFRYLAMHPSTARYIAQSLALRFVSDTPPKSLVDALAKTYLQHKGNIKPVLMTLFSRSEFWGSVGQKVRRPMEYLVATFRVLGVSPQTPAGYTKGAPRTPFGDGLRQIREKMEELGQFPTGMPTPNGYPDVFVAWTAAGSMIDGWNEATKIINGDYQMFTDLRPEQLVGAKPPATAGAYLDTLAKRLVHQALPAHQKNLVLGIAGATADTKVDARFNGAITAVARALLASPYHHLR